MDEEMMLVTTEVIARAAFDCRLSIEDRLEFSHKMRQVMTVFLPSRTQSFQKVLGVWLC
jgi:hypothetical protein